MIDDHAQEAWIARTVSFHHRLPCHAGVQHPFDALEIHPTSRREMFPPSRMPSAGSRIPLDDLRWKRISHGTPAPAPAKQRLFPVVALGTESSGGYFPWLPHQPVSRTGGVVHPLLTDHP